MQDLQQSVIGLLPLLPSAPGDRLPAGASPQQIAEFQQRVGVILPESLTEWLSVCNGPMVGPGGIFGVRPDLPFLDIENRWASLPAWCHRRHIPVASDGCGSNYLLGLASVDGLHPVFFLDHEDEGVTEEPSFVVASNLWHFLRFLLSKELGEKGWPFNEEMVLGADPQLAKLEAWHLPWHS
ncbi:SMI1/KNR4 family protein [bacterium]|nr:MAG: SMI1/KNR4 family protein [bacterium]